MINFNELIKFAFKKNASNIHITTNAPIHMRVDGELRALNTKEMNDTDILEIINEITNDKQKLILEQEFEVDLAYESVKDHRLRINIFKQASNYGIVIRLLKSKIPLPVEIGLPLPLIELASQKSGLILVTGPTGVGKSTTLASLVSHMNTLYSKHIITIEDPIEFVYYHKEGMVLQIDISEELKNSDELEVGSMKLEHTKTSNYASFINATLRQNPDILVVGEIRDQETASIISNAASTGQLVISSMHANNVASAISRLNDMKVPIKVLASALSCVVSQNLVKKLCEHCKVKRKTTNEEKARLGLNSGLDIYEPKGCEHCSHIGYDGQIAVFEVLEVNKAFRQSLVNQESKDINKKINQLLGNNQLADITKNLVKNGITSIDELIMITEQW